MSIGVPVPGPPAPMTDDDSDFASSNDSSLISSSNDSDIDVDEALDEVEGDDSLSESKELSLNSDSISNLSLKKVPALPTM